MTLMFTRFALWLGRDDHAFTLLLFATLPALVAIITIDFVGS